MLLTLWLRRLSAAHLEELMWHWLSRGGGSGGWGAFRRCHLRKKPEWPSDQWPKHPWKSPIHLEPQDFSRGRSCRLQTDGPETAGTSGEQWLMGNVVSPDAKHTLAAFSENCVSCHQDVQSKTFLLNFQPLATSCHTCRRSNKVSVSAGGPEQRAKHDVFWRYLEHV